MIRFLLIALNLLDFEASHDGSTINTSFTVIHQTKMGKIKETLARQKQTKKLNFKNNSPMESH